MALITYLPALIFASGWVVFGTTGGVFRPFALLAAVGAAVTVWCTGMIYASLKPIRQWHHPLVAPIYLAFALMSGACWRCRCWRSPARRMGGPAGWRSRRSCSPGRSRRSGGARSIATSPSARPRAPPASAASASSACSIRRTPRPTICCTRWRSGSAAGMRRKLRRLSYASGFCAALVLSLLTLLSTGVLAGLLAALAAAVGLTGVAIERWLFFAEARHTVTLYYRRRPPDRPARRRAGAPTLALASVASRPALAPSRQ